MTGELTRAAKLGRFQFSGVLRMGEERVIPTFRLGLGFQLVSTRSRLTNGANSMAGPGDGIDLTATGAFGAGIDIRLTAGLTAGVSMSFVVPENTKLFNRAFASGLHLSYVLGSRQSMPSIASPSQ